MKLSYFILALFMFGVTHHIVAYPISPRPLRKLIIESEHIVFANVVDIKEDVSGGDPFFSTKAILVINEILQGKIKTDTIHVFFSPGMVCPAPAEYEKGTKVLVFLDDWEQGSGYTTHALSYGSKRLDDLGYSIYRKRIKEMQEILKIKNDKEKIRSTIDWLVTCASHPKTRWEGLYELSPESDFMSYYDQNQDTFVKKYKLNNKQLQKLRKSFFAIDKIGYTDIPLIDLVVTENDKEALAFLVHQIKSIELESLWYKEFLFIRVAELTNRDDLRYIVSEMESLDFMDEKRDKKSIILAKEFIERL